MRFATIRLEGNKFDFVGGADEVGKHCQEAAAQQREDGRDDRSTHKALNRLLGRNQQKSRAAKVNSTEIRKDVVADDATSGHKEPEDAAVNKTYECHRRADDEEQGQDEVSELLHLVAYAKPSQGHDERDEPEKKQDKDDH